MKLFTSKREKRLWIWTLVFIVGIFSTLVLGPRLAGIIRERGMLTPLFFLCLFLVIGTVAFMALKKRRSGAELGIILGASAIYLLAFARMSIAEERGHLIEYSIVAVFILEALRERVSQGGRVPMPALMSIGVTSFIGTIDECIQLFLATRVFDPLDILFNFIAAVMAVTTSLALTWARKRASKLIQDKK